jgi:hypothetical protein
MISRGWIRRGAGALFVTAAVLLPAAPSALANSGSMTVADAGGGRMSVTAEASVSDCGGATCPWSAVIRERHSSLPCANSRDFKVGVVGFATQAGTMRETIAFRPFFPRFAKLCLYVQVLPGGTELVAETTYKVPPKYGRLRSTAAGCSDFESQSAAQYYLYMYPDDPSDLDPAHKGVACESNPCPCGAERIPAEPAETSPPVAGSQVCTSARSRERQAILAVKAAARHLRKAAAPVAKRRWKQKLTKRKAALRKAKAQVRKVCPTSQ